MSRGNGEAPRQEPKKRKSKNKGKSKSGGGGFAGWQKHSALAKVDQGLLRGLHKWSAQKTFTHQFRVTAAPTDQAPPRQHIYPPPQAREYAPGLAAVKHAQRLERMAALASEAKQEGRAATRRGSGPSSLGELYALYKASGRIAEFLSLFPSP